MEPTRRDVLRAIGLGMGAAAVTACAPPRVRQAPTPAPPPYGGAVGGGVRRIAYGNGPQQFGHLRLPDAPGPHPVVVSLHGGFWLSNEDLELMTPACEALRARGIATWNVEYRRLGDQGGGWPNTFLDAAAALDQLRTLASAHGLDLQRVVTLGHSAGGQLALWLAGRRWIRDGDLRAASPLRVRGAVSLAGVVDLERAWQLFEVVGQLLGGSPEDVPVRYATASPAALLPLGVPQVLVHGRDDRVVPVSLSKAYRDMAHERGDDVVLVTPAVGHSELIDPRTAAWNDVLQALTTVGLRLS